MDLEVNGFEGISKPITIRDNLRKWEIDHVWLSRIFVYFSLFIAILIIGGLFIISLHLNNSDVDSGRYFLSSLVQCQAAIISIVISLTLIAVQLTAQKYSFKTLEIFKKDPDMWLLLFIYLISIIYEFLILKEINGSAYITDNLGIFVSVAYLFGIFTFVALVPYILNTINLLRSDVLILRLINSINSNNFPGSRDYLEYNPDDPLQPIFNVIQTSIKQYDISTLDFALNRLLERMSTILQQDNKERASDTISDYFCENLKRSGLLAMERGDKEAFSIINNSLEEFGKVKSNRANGSNTVSSIYALNELGEYSAEKNYEIITHWIVNSLRLLGNFGAENRIRNVTSYSISALKEIDRIIIEKPSGEFLKSEEILDKIVVDITNIAEEIIRHSDIITQSDDRYAICDPIIALNDMGQLRLSYKKYDELSTIVSSIGNIGYLTAIRYSNTNGFERPLHEAVESLRLIGLSSADYEFGYPTSKSIKSLSELLQDFVEKNVDTLALETLSAIYQIYSKIKQNNKLENSLEQLVKSLIHFLCYIREKNIDNELSKEINIIGRLKKINKENNSTFTKVVSDLRLEQSDLPETDQERITLEAVLTEIYR